MTKEEFNWQYKELVRKAEEEKPSYRDFAEDISNLLVTYFRQAIDQVG